MVTIIIVTFNSENFIRKCIESIYDKTKEIDFEIIVVDNNSSDRTTEIIYREFKNVRLIRNRRNVGFGAANNIAIARSAGEFIMLLNPDTVLENNAIRILVDHLKRDPKIGCAGAKLQYFDGTLQLSCRKFPNYINVFFGRRSIIRHLFPKNPVSREFMLENMDYNCVQEVDWIMGAAMIMRRSTIEEIGSFDESYFLFVEDTDLCYRMMMASKKVVYVPSAHIRHFHGASVSKGFSKAQLHHNIGMYKFFRKHSIPKNKLLEFVLYCAILIRLSIVFATEQIITILNFFRRKPMEEYR
ncbi:MAG: glycosyltransferase family 2 protein [bacterium]|nr:glycosyltransferase family 2 protein [bacterium]